MSQKQSRDANVAPVKLTHCGVLAFVFSVAGCGQSPPAQAPRVSSTETKPIETGAADAGTPASVGADASAVPDGGNVVRSEYVATRFDGREGWHPSDAKLASNKLDQGKWTIDFADPNGSASIAPEDFSLPGVPRELALRVRGSTGGRPVRLVLTTHFMSFERVLDPIDAPQEREIAFPAPPADGWRYFGGENDNRLHGPLRIASVSIDAGGKKGPVDLTLVSLQASVDHPANQALTLLASADQDGGRFTARVRSQEASSRDVELAWTIRDWQKHVLAEGARTISVSGAAPAEATVSAPRDAHAVVEAEFRVRAEGQIVPPQHAYFVQAIEPRHAKGDDPKSPFGMGLYLYRYPDTDEGFRDMDRAAALAEQAGVRWTREEFGWATMAPERGKIDFHYFDKLVATAKRHGIKVYGLLTYWSNWTKPYTPEGIEDYANWASALVSRYRNDVDHWEVYNEPNIFFWQGPKDMYADLLKKTYAAIKKANPKATVLGCATAEIATDFIRRTIELGGPFDILTIHPYREKLDDRKLIDELKGVSDLVRPKAGPRRPVWITEMGWSTYVQHDTLKSDFPLVSEREQAALLARTYLSALASGVTSNIAWYDFRNDDSDPMYGEGNAGIVQRDFRPKPAYRAFATMTRLVDGMVVDREVSLGDGVMAFDWKPRDAKHGSKHKLFIAWSTRDDRTIDIDATGPVVVTNLVGEEETLQPTSGKVKVSLLAGTPIFVTAAHQ